MLVVVVKIFVEVDIFVVAWVTFAVEVAKNVSEVVIFVEEVDE